MAFALTDYKAYGLDISEPVQKRAIQVFECTITGTTADIALDIGDTAGTAWTAIDDNALGLAAKTAFAEILGKVERLVSYSVPEILHGLPHTYNSTSPTTGNVGIVNNTAKTCPNFKFYTGEGLTSYKFVFTWSLKNEQKAVRAGW